MGHLRASALEHGDGVGLVAAEQLAVQLLRPAPGRAGAEAFLDRLARDAIDVRDALPAGTHLSVAMAVWVCKRMLSAASASVETYVVKVASRLHLALGIDPSKDPVVRRVLRKAAVLEGARLAVGERPSLPYESYLAFIALVAVPREVRAGVILAWRRIARVGDVGGMRQGDLALPLPGHAASPRPVPGWVALWAAHLFHKASPTGEYTRRVLMVTEFEWSVIRPWVSPSLAEGHPLARPLLLPHVSARVVRDHFRVALGAEYGAASIRRGAAQRAIRCGCPVGVLAMAMLHRDTRSTHRYLRTPGVEAAAAALATQGIGA